MMNKGLLIGMVLAVAVAQGAGWQLELNTSTGGQVRYGDNLVAEIKPGLHTTRWRRWEINRFDHGIAEPGGQIRGLGGDAEQRFTSALDTRRVDTKTQHFAYVLTTHQDTVLCSFHVSFMFPVKAVLAKTFRVDDQVPQAYPQKFTRETKHIFTGAVSRLEMDTEYGKLVFAFKEPTVVLVQDNRNWGDNFCVRIQHPRPAESAWQAGETFAFAMDLSFPEPYELERNEPLRIVEGADWVKLDYRLGIKAGTALDFSTMQLLDGPAGKYGWARAAGDHFEFAGLPGKSQRFYGVNLVGSAAVISHEQSLELADRLCRSGYNTVRYHHYANAVFKPENGCSTNLNPVKMEQFDFLFAELKKRGIYATTDVFSSRGVYASEIWADGEERLMEFREFRPHIAVNPKALENVKTFARNFFLHRNPYTGLTYAEDPALPWICLINEGNSVPRPGSGRAYQAWLDAWNKWLLEKYGTTAKRNQAWGIDAPEVMTAYHTSPASAPIAAEWRDFELFQVDMEKRLYDNLAAFMREELGCKAMLTSMNHSWLNPRGATIRERFDYVDQHFYVDHPFFPVKRWQVPSSSKNDNLVKTGNIGGTQHAFGRHYGKPFTVTEFNYSAPGQYRGVGGILTGCLGALQDWSGIWRFAYAHGKGPIFTPGRMAYFDTARDPLNQAADRATVCLYLRGDMAAADKSIAISMPEDYLEQCTDFPIQNISPRWQKLVSLARVGIVVGPATRRAPGDIVLALGKNGPQAADMIAGDSLGDEGGAALFARIRAQQWLPASNVTDMEGGLARVQSQNGQFTVDSARGVMLIDTPHTAGGFGPADSHLATAALAADIFDTETTLWASSVDARPLQDSRRILLTHLTDLQNSGIHFAEKERRTLLNWGDLPFLVRQGRARVVLRHNRPQTLKAWVLHTDGERRAEWPVQQVPGGICLELAVRGADGAQMLYEISE
ncbi:MAG: hypothetical protein PHT80_10995 [Lentisphaeria bacterium]|nr:hypothetical protein [Lentisphaeria bacterium]